MKVKYGELGLYISGVEHPPALEEWAHAIVRIQKEIDKGGGEKYILRKREKQIERHPTELEMHIAELEVELAEARLKLARLRARNQLDRKERKSESEADPRRELERFVGKMKEHYPKFSYKWVGMREGNVEAAYGDNSLVIKGVEDGGARHEIAVHLISLQKKIDKLSHFDDFKERE